MSASSDINLFISGCENSDSQYCFSRRRKIKLALYIAIGIVCSKYRELGPGDLVFLFGRLHERMLGDSGSAIHHAAAALPLSRMRTCATIFSSFRLTERLSLLFCALKRGGIGKDRVRYIEYSFFAATLDRRANLSPGKPFMVVTASMTDRYVTWISGLCERYDLPLVIYQHGTLLHFAGLPHRIKASKFYVYNEHEKQCVQQGIVANSGCKYEYYPFKSNVHFKYIAKQDSTFYIGVVSQHNKEFNQRALEVISRLYPNAVVLLMLHPAETYDSFYQNLERQYRQLKVYVDEKFLNVDMLVLNNSTMIYDYVCSGYKSTIIVIAEERLYDFLTDGIEYYNSFQSWLDEVGNDKC